MSRIFDIVCDMFDTHLCDTVSAAVRETAAELGLTQTSIAAELGLTRQALNNRLQGRTHWTVSELPQLEHLTGRTLDQLIGGDR